MIILDYQGHKIYTARGKGGQYLMILPEIKAVVVVLQEWNLKKEFDVENNLLCELFSILFNDNKYRLKPIDKSGISLVK